MVLCGVLAAARVGVSAAELLESASAAAIAPADAEAALARAREAGLVRERGGALELSAEGVRAFLELHAAIVSALDPSPSSPSHESCPSVPWLTTVQTAWIDALSFNYAVEPAALAPLLPAPLEPELHKGSAWVQVLVSSLRDMRPQGLFSLFGVCFYQVSYRAAVRYVSADGTPRRGGYFVRSETSHEVMRAVGNALAEFKFHDFGTAELVMLRDGPLLTVGITPEEARPGGRLVSIVDTTPLSGPPAGSVWSSLEELHEPLVECYDALGVDARAGCLYLLTIDRDPWNPVFVSPVSHWCEWAETPPFAGRCRLDSVLHLPRPCGYRWRPLRRERLGLAPPLPGSGS